MHGTDTMAETASTLSFRLQNLGKPVIMTGAQAPMGVDGSDPGVQNVAHSILLATFDIPEVAIFFRYNFLARE